MEETFCYLPRPRRFRVAGRRKNKAPALPPVFIHRSRPLPETYSPARPPGFPGPSGPRVHSLPANPAHAGGEAPLPEEVASALEAIEEHLRRMRALALAATAPGLSDARRAAIQLQINRLASAIDRIAAAAGIDGR